MDAEQAATLVNAAIAGDRLEQPGRRAAGGPTPRALHRLDRATGCGGFRGAGRHWSPAFRRHVGAGGRRPVSGYVAAGAGGVEFRAVDLAGLLRLQLVVELLTTGLLRVRASVTNLAEEAYTVDALTPALPVPADADELLDFAGRHNQERVPQRTPLRTGIHLRENRKGRTGADARYRAARRHPGLRVRRGEVWAVHTAWSGNHVHYAERVFTGEQRARRRRAAAARRDRARPRARATPARGSTASYGDGLDEVARRFHRHLRARPRTGPPTRPVTLNVWEAVYFDHDLDRLHRPRRAGRRASASSATCSTTAGSASRRDDRCGPRRLDRLAGRLAGRAAPAGRPGHASSACSSGCGSSPRWSTSTPTSPAPTRSGSWRPATGLPVESRHQQVLNLGIREALRAHQRAILALLAEYDIGYIKWDHNRDLIDAGTQPRRPARRARADPRVLPAARRDPGGASRSWRSSRARPAAPGSTSACWSAPTGSGCRTTSTRTTGSRCCAGPPSCCPPELTGLAHRLRPLAHDRPHPRPRLPGRHRASSATSASSGTSRKATDAELAELGAWIAFYKEHRGLLLGGDLVRMDGVGEPTSTCTAWSHRTGRGRCSRSRPPTASTRTRHRGCTFRGLDPEQAYRVRPVFVGSVPSGLRAPRWWGQPRKQATPHSPDRPHELDDPARRRLPGRGLPRVPRSSTRVSPPPSSTPIRLC